MEARIARENKIAKTESAHEQTNDIAATIPSPFTSSAPHPDHQDHPLSAGITSTEATNSSMVANPSSSHDASAPSAPSQSVSSGVKRKGDSDGNPDSSRSRVEASRGEKRTSEKMEPDNGDMSLISGWVDELCRLPHEVGETIMIIDNLESAIGDDVMEVFSPPRVVSVAKKCGLQGGHSIDRMVEKSPGVRWDLRKKCH